MKNRKGLTLVEVILSIAIIGIVLISVLNIFGVGIKNISSSGNRTREVLDAQMIIDEEVSKKNEKPDPEALDPEEPTSENIEIINNVNIGFKIDEDEITVEGKLIKTTISDSKNEIKTFIPYPQDLQE